MPPHCAALPAKPVTFCNDAFVFRPALLAYEFSAFVKRADLEHNLSDLKEGSLKEKYRLALYVLSGSIWD